MPPKDRKLSYFDLAPAGAGTASGLNVSEDVSGGASIAIAAPSNVVLTSGVINSNAAPAAYVDVTFNPPETNTGMRPDRYTVQASTNTTFTASGTITMEVAPSDPDAPVIRIDGLAPNTLYYVRLRGIVTGYPGAWSSMSPLADNVNRITTAQDLTAAGVPTTIAATWIGYGDLLITWTNPSEANLKDVQVVIRASAGGTIYRTAYSAAQRFLYTVAMNIQDTAGVGDPSLYVELKSRTFNNVLGTTVNTGLTTKPAPATPSSVSHTWSGDTGTAGADLTLTWAEQGDAAFHYVSINGLAARRVTGTVYTYAYSRNVAENGGNGDPTLTYGIQAVDGLGQGSTTASGSATNAAPAAPTATLSQGAVSGVTAEVTSTPPADIWRYEYVFKRDGTTVATVYSPGTSYTYEMQGAGDGGFHSWTVVIRQQDLFAQFSSTVTPAAVAFEGITLSYLRDGIEYGDSLGTAAATLKAAFADGVVDSGGVSYNA